jgi:GT2 family glycosyltransferase
MNREPSISVVMPTHNRSASLEQGLAALLSQRYPLDRYEIIVVNDASTDRTPVLLKTLEETYTGRLRVFHQDRNRGPAAARNRGVAESKGSLVAFTDDDCVVAPNWLEQVQRGYQEPGIVGVGGEVLPLATDSTIQRYYARYSVIAQPAMQQGQIWYLVTANASFKRDCLLEVGGFDETLTIAGGEDPDICLRLRQLGYRFGYNPQAIVYHNYTSSLSAFLHTFRNYGEGTAFYELRHRDVFLGHHALWSIGMLVWPYRLWRHHQAGLRGLDLLAFPFVDALRALSFLLGLGYGHVVHGEMGR